MSYIDQGYNQFLERSIIPRKEDISAVDADLLLEGLSGQKILGGGSVQSADGRLNMNLGDNIFSINDGTTERVKLGRFEDGEYGLRVIDRDGNILFNISGLTNLIQSADGEIQIDLTAKQIIMKDGGKTTLIIGETDV